LGLGPLACSLVYSNLPILVFTARPFSLQAVTFGDVNGDGQLEVVVGTLSGKIYVMSGKTGKDIKPFPFQVGA
jgi:hypothetical protein